MAEENTHGGKREGAGRPKAPAHLRKVQVAYRLPQWLVDWIREQPDTAASIIETAVMEKHNLTPPDFS